MATKNLCFRLLLMLNHNCAKLYLILTRNLLITWAKNIEYIQILVMISQFLLKGHKMLNFHFAFLLKISGTLKAHISGTKADINKR